MSNIQLTEAEQRSISRTKREIRKNEKALIFHTLFEIEGVNSEEIAKDSKQKIADLSQRL